MQKNLTLAYLWLTIMRITAIQIGITLLLTGITRAGEAQELLDKRISIAEKTVEARAAITEISGLANVRISYNSKLIPKKTIIKVYASNETVSQVLHRTLSPLNVSFILVDQQIILRKTETPPPSQGSTPAEAAADKQESAIERNLNGTVKDERGEPLPGVSVIVKGTGRGTTTDVDGRYSIDIPDDSNTLIFSFVGYLSQEIPVSKERTALDVLLEVDEKALEEIVIIGYGEQKKANLTGAVGSISAREFETRPVTNVLQSLQGQVPGLFVNQTGGQPGDESFSMRIRGASTFSGNEPLVIVDGIAMSMFALNPQDIESVTVLKDAASTAIYGARASGGVILVTTKKGKDGKMKFSYDGYVGRQSPTMLPQMVNAYEHVLLWREAQYNDNPNTTVFKYNEEQVEKYRTGELPSEDRLAYLFGPAGQSQHNISLSGGSAKNSYFISLGYLSQEGLMRNTSSERINIRLNNTYKISKRFDVNFNVQLSPLKRHAPSAATYPSGPTRNVQDIIHDAYRRGSDDVTFTRDGQWASITGWANRFGLASEDGGFQNRKFHRFTGAITANYKFTDHLSVNAMYGNKTDLTRQIDYSKRMKFINPLDLKTVDFDYNTNSLLVFHQDNFQHNGQVLINYDRIFNTRHEFKALLGASQEWNQDTQESVGRRDFITDDIYVIDAGSSDPSTWTTSGTASAWAIRSYFGRINYVLKNKYLFEGNLRYDGSSRFAASKRWGLFPSFSAGWRISEEAFMSNFSTTGDLKLRASWGKVGNQNIALYQYYSTISTTAYYFNGTAQTGTLYSGSPNPNLRWETKTTTNIGLDLGLLRGKLLLTLDVFKDRTNGILMVPAVPSSYGLSAPVQNVATVDNYGWESQISYRDKKGDFSYGASFQISDARNKVVSMIASPQIASNKITEIGYEMNEWFGYKSIGIFGSQTEVDNYARLNPRTGVGDLKIEDINNDGQITAADRQRLGSSLTRLPYGLHLSLGWKNFDFSTFLQGVAYRKTYMSSVALPLASSLETAQKQHLDRWRPDENGEWVEGKFPKLRIGSFNNTFSSFWLQNGAYIRLKNLQVGYTIPASLMQKLKVDRLRIYASGENLFTVTKVYGYDPESPDGSGNFYPLSRVVNVGVNLSF